MWSTLRSSRELISDRPTEEELIDAQEVVLVAANAAAAKKGEATTVLAVGDIIAITDWFVLTSASNVRLVKTIVDEIEAEVKAQTGRSPRSVEGVPSSGWVLMDYGDFVVHVFRSDIREFYDLDRLWADAPRVAWEPVPAAGVS